MSTPSSFGELPSPIFKYRANNLAHTKFCACVLPAISPLFFALITTALLTVTTHAAAQCGSVLTNIILLPSTIRTCVECADGDFNTAIGSSYADEGPGQTSARYRGSPLEVMAYDLDARFQRERDPFIVEQNVRQQLAALYARG